jgi:hypothetical protein
MGIRELLFWACHRFMRFAVAVRVLLRLYCRLGDAGISRRRVPPHDSG